jgi:hypothetical protein
MTNQSFYFNIPKERSPITSNDPIPALSTNLDSIRTYQWEIQFKVPDILGQDAIRYLTLAAKQVTQIGFMVEDIEVHRMNERFYYPGKASTEELTVTFDNLMQKDVSEYLFRWMQNTHNPTTGKQGYAQIIKGQAKVLQLGPDGTPLKSVLLGGIYPKSWKGAEHNYATTNEFHTIEMKFRYDTIIHDSLAVPSILNPAGP